MTDPMLPQPVRVLDYREETHDTFSLRLSSEKGSLGPFLPGQFNMLYVHGIGEVPISISSDPAQPAEITHTIREVGAVTKALRGLRENDRVGLRGPFGRSWPVEKTEGKDIVIITGGIGLAPLRPAIYRILADRKKIKRFALLYGARTPQDILYPEELKSWRSKLDLQVRVTVDNADENWYGTVGVVTMLLAKARFDPTNTLAMICGPEIMMHYAVHELMGEGVDAASIYVSMERNMKCAVGYCGHCQYGPNFICKDGPVFAYNEIEHLFALREV